MSAVISRHNSADNANSAIRYSLRFTQREDGRASTHVPIPLGVIEVVREAEADEVPPCVASGESNASRGSGDS